MININNILRCFPSKIIKEFDSFIKTNSINLDYLEEIRLRVNRPIILKVGQIDYIIKYNINSDELLVILQQICDNSIYSYQNQICNGYITLKGGHRVGIAGNVVIKDGKVINISHISSLNFRIAKQIIGASNEIIKHVISFDTNDNCYNNNNINNTLIVSPPGVRKNYYIKRFNKKNK